jgi:hypothetical protein
MKTRTAPFLALALAFGLAAAPAAAQDVAGRWVMDVNLDAGSGQATFLFEVDGSNITGTYGGVLGEQQITGTIEGNVVRFGFASPDAGEVTFDGIVEGNTMEGTCEYGLLGSGTFSGSKAG